MTTIILYLLVCGCIMLGTALDELDAERLDEVFGGEGAFQKYLDEHRTEIKECFITLKQLV